MVERLRKAHPFRALFAWFSRGHRLTALIVITAVIAVSALAYSFVNDRSQSAAEKAAAADRAAFYACVPKYVSDLSRTNLPRTIASIEASNARFNWDRGYDKHHPTWGKKQLKAEYVRLYRKYQAVIVTNPPLPAFSAKYCEAKPGDRTPSPSASPSTTHSTKPAAKSDGDPSPAGTTNVPTPGGKATHAPSSSHGHDSSGSTSHPPSSGPTLPPLTGELLPGTTGFICAMIPGLCGQLGALVH